ncbi:MAG: L-seryl-tRNA(Sec) selenium transferase, partial [Pyrinomonadaceae bacterium]|nr:L-seryl-tRNA(Sec) selenium transferase [Pyrinomonadaceae bacterium]
MQSEKAVNKTEVLRNLPSINELLQGETALRIVGEAGAKHLAGLARFVTDSLREEMRQALSSDTYDESKFSRELLLGEAERRLEEAWKQEQKSGLQRVINATGVAIHTNLGRAPLSEKAKRAIIDEASRYCSLEYNVETGKRGKRGARVEHLLAELTGAEAALVVNNCAAAAILVLTALARGGESIISRGELVEIGGDFRVPDLMTQSGTTLVEVGTTNKTRISDYERAITENTRLITKVHTSNYRIVGFTSTPTVKELSEMANRNEILLFEDAGSGALIDLSEYGLRDEPIISESIASGADVVTFSGDKLLGGTQAGLIVGRSEVIAHIRKHPLYRALRTSKFIYAALEKTLDAFRKETAIEEIPILRMISMSEEEIRQRTESFAEKLKARTAGNMKLNIEVVKGRSVIGGGSAPDVQPATALLVLSHSEMSVSKLEEKLRSATPPVVGRVLEDRYLLD